MNEPLKSLAKMILATLVGLTIVTIVALVIHFKLAEIVVTLFPSPPEPDPPPNPGLSVVRLPANFDIYLTFLAFSVLLNGCIGSFTAEFLFRRLAGQAGSRTWQSFIIGFIIGFFSLNLQEVLRNKPITMTGPLLYGLFTALIGLLGYYLAGRKYHRRISS
jgi:hypothetical protein